MTSSTGRFRSASRSGSARRGTTRSPRCAASAAPEFVRDSVSSVDTDARTVTLGRGELLGYDILILAVGANAYPAFEHGATFDREQAPDDFDEVLSATRGGLAPRVAIVAPEGATWTLPAYELAMLTRYGFPKSDVTVVSYERTPLEAFGAVASAGVAEILTSAGVAFRGGTGAEVVTPTALRLGWEWFEAERIVSLPLLRGPHIPGVPADAHGFICVDEYSRVAGLDDVYAAGDGTILPVKQGGLASQQADAAVLHIAARLGGAMTPRPLTPVLRGLLLTPRGPRFLRAELSDTERTSAISAEPLWWPPSKIASRWLAPHLERVDMQRATGLVAAGI